MKPIDKFYLCESLVKSQILDHELKQFFSKNELGNSNFSRAYFSIEKDRPELNVVKMADAVVKFVRNCPIIDVQ